jgi:hypothetical protein
VGVDIDEVEPLDSLLGQYLSSQMPLPIPKLHVRVHKFEGTPSAYLCLAALNLVNPSSQVEFRPYLSFQREGKEDTAPVALGAAKFTKRWVREFTSSVLTHRSRSSCCSLEALMSPMRSTLPALVDSEPGGVWTRKKRTVWKSESRMSSQVILTSGVIQILGVQLTSNKKSGLDMNTLAIRSRVGYDAMYSRRNHEDMDSMPWKRAKGPRRA